MSGALGSGAWSARSLGAAQLAADTLRTLRAQPRQASSASSSVGTWPHTVFVVSWHNPGGEDRETGLADYRTLGVLAALDAIGRVVPDRPVHAAGYCLGGPRLTIALAPGTYVLER